ncbi:MAG: hypothetical protein RLZZ324_479 [Candidatus Parcubacteria bacterium]|jgi:hypothetical protein
MSSKHSAISSHLTLGQLRSALHLAKERQLDALRRRVTLLGQLKRVANGVFFASIPTFATLIAVALATKPGTASFERAFHYGVVASLWIGAIAFFASVALVSWCDEAATALALKEDATLWRRYSVLEEPDSELAAADTTTPTHG